MESPCSRGHQATVGHVISRPGWRAPPNLVEMKGKLHPDRIQTTDTASSATYPCPRYIWHVNTNLQGPIQLRRACNWACLCRYRPGVPSLTTRRRAHPDIVSGFNSLHRLRTAAEYLIRNPWNSQILIVTLSHRPVSGAVHSTRGSCRTKRHWPVWPSVASSARVKRFGASWDAAAWQRKTGQYGFRG